MAIGSSSLSSDASPANGARSEQFVEMLSLMADPAALQAKVAQLRAASENAVLRDEVLAPAAELTALKARAKLDADQAAKEVADLKRRASEILAQAESEASAIIANASDRASSFIAKANAVLDDVNALASAREASRVETSAILNQLISDLRAKVISATEREARAIVREESAERREAEAKARSADLARRFDEIRAIVGA